MVKFELGHLVLLDDKTVWTLNDNGIICDDLFVAYMLIWKNVCPTEEGWDQYIISRGSIQRFYTIYKRWEEGLIDDQDAVILLKNHYPQMFVRANKGEI